MTARPSAAGMAARAKNRIIVGIPSSCAACARSLRYGPADRERASVTLHGRVDFDGPPFNAALQVLHVGEASLGEEHRGVLAAPARVADHHERSLARQL